MDGRLRERLNSIGEELERVLEPSKKSRKAHFTAASPCDKILKKWKYKPRKTTSNRFLSRDKQCPYENVVLNIKEDYPGFNLHSYDDLMNRCRRIQDGTREQWLCWDNRWINPLSVSSKGWDFCVLQNENLTFKCVTCSSTLCLRLSSTSELNKGYWEKYVPLEHSIDCPWRKNRFDLENEYYVQPWNLIRELERISRLREIGESNKDLYNLCKQGYEMVEGDVVQCTGCFKKAFAKSILGSQTNFHDEWCKYYDCEKLDRLLEKSVVVPMGKDINGRLKLLENYFETM